MPCLDWMGGFKRKLVFEAEITFDSRYLGKKEATIQSRRPQIPPPPHTHLGQNSLHPPPGAGSHSRKPVLMATEGEKSPLGSRGCKFPTRSRAYHCCQARQGF